jgi:hypothetical protein
MTDYADGPGRWFFNNSGYCGASCAQAMEEAQIDEQIDQSVLIGNGGAIPQMRSFDAEVDRLRVDPFDGGALPIDLFVTVAVAIQRVADAGPDADGHHGGTAALLPLRMTDRATLVRGVEWADVFAAFMFDDTRGAIGVGELERHGQTCLAERPTIRGELPLFGFVVTLFGKGHGGEAIVGVVVAVKIGINIPGIEGGIEGGIAGTITESFLGLLHQG